MALQVFCSPWGLSAVGALLCSPRYSLVTTTQNMDCWWLPCCWLLGGFGALLIVWKVSSIPHTRSYVRIHPKYQVMPSSLCL